MKILFVEDDQDIQLFYNNQLKNLNAEIVPLWACSVEEGVAMVRDNPDIAIIVVDGELGEKSGLEFVETVRPQFLGKIIAASSSRSACEALVTVGANVSCNGDKMKVGNLIKGFLVPSS